jgi:hypothetical protein
LWDDSVVPGTIDAGDPNGIEVGVKFIAAEDLDVVGVRFYKSAANTGTHVGSLWDTSGSLLAQVTFTGESTAGWQQATFSAPVRITANTTYVVSYHAPNGSYSADGGYFSATYSNGPLTAPKSGSSGGNGVYAYSSTGTFPTATFGASNYWVTPVYEVPPDITPPSLAATTPVDGASSVAVDTTISATFNEPVQAATVNFTLRDGGGATVAGSTVFDAATDTVTFTPSAPLNVDTSYSAEVSATDLVGNATPSPLQYSFTTATGATVAALWDDTAVPGVASANDTGSVNLGVKFTSSEDLLIVGVRFYKGPANTGTHVGSLWDTSGSLLAQATFVGESAAGWQDVLFSTPVAITAGATYVASYHAPDGGYSYEKNYLKNPYVNEPLTAPSSNSSGGNGVYTYDPAPVFPTSSGRGANYWVTPVYEIP